MIEEEDDEDTTIILPTKVKPPPLSMVTKVSYGIGEVALYVPTSIENIFLPTFLLEVAGLGAKKVYFGCNSLIFLIFFFPS
jgi:Na+/melibiose symporter-like transporter